MKLAFGLLLAFSPAIACAQQTGWEGLGRTLGSRDQPAVPIVETNKLPEAAAGEWNSCLQSALRRLASPNESVEVIVVATKSACARERAVFYGAVYKDSRNDAGKNSSIRVANHVIARHDAAIDAGLPEDVIMVKQQASSRTPERGRFAEIRELKMLLDTGALSQEEFDTEKRKILESK